MDNLARLTADIEIGLRENESTIVAFLDVASAYDNVRKDLLIGKLKREGCPMQITKYINEWMKERFTKFIVTEEKEVWRIINTEN